MNHPEFGRIYAYETDGYGNYMLMDDANVPSLLSIHYLGFKDQNDPVYQNTRRFILSKNNPYFYQGTAAAGIGSPHTPENHIWYIALSMQGLTGTETEAKGMIKMILKTDNNENVTQESFHKNDPGQISCLQNLFTKHTCRNKQKRLFHTVIFYFIQMKFSFYYPKNRMILLSITLFVSFSFVFNNKHNLFQIIIR